MARKKPKINLAPETKPHTGDLAQLFSSDNDTEQAAGMQLVALRLEAIQPDPAQPRTTFPEDSLNELANSIQQDGVIQPIEVVEISPNRYLIVHGERRWRAAQLAGLSTIPAVVRRRDYDEVTRFVRQMVENIQREDLNDVDRAAGLIRLRDLMQEELDKAREENVPSDQPWGSKISWAKVGDRLGYSRQRIHQLIKLLDLPDEIKTDVRDGRISERDTRVYQGLKPSQMRALHKARLAGDVTDKQVKQIASILKDNPDQTVYQTIRLLQEAEKAASAPEPDITAEHNLFHVEQNEAEEQWTAMEETAVPDNFPLPDLAPGSERITNARRLGYVRQHLARIQRAGLTAAERAEVLRLLSLIEQDVTSLINALRSDTR